MAETVSMPDSRSPIGVEDKFRGNDTGMTSLVKELQSWLLLGMSAASKPASCPY